VKSISINNYRIFVKEKGGQASLNQLVESYSWLSLVYFLLN